MIFYFPMFYYFNMFALDKSIEELQELIEAYMMSMLEYKFMNAEMESISNDIAPYSKYFYPVVLIMYAIGFNDTERILIPKVTNSIKTNDQFEIFLNATIWLLTITFRGLVFLKYSILYKIERSDKEETVLCKE